ncbi:hypothetical protein E2C01_078234 [Portunus trituberculatus]|uniref:Uncharacterized protein n=1 Tax=Portunus trituberculatus TaxID=210409 RepID=A0A5B7II69_PORTR|nr:hypothetical protein [Portunus trituberculatus]
MSAVTKFKVSQSREGAQGTSAIARLRLGHTTLDAHRLRLSRDPFCPCTLWLSTLAITTLDLPILLTTSGVHPLLATCCPLPYLCLLEEDRPATTPVIPTQDYSRAHKDPKEATKIYGSL